MFFKVSLMTMLHDTAFRQFAPRPSLNRLRSNAAAPETRESQMYEIKSEIMSQIGHTGTRLYNYTAKLFVSMNKK